MKVGIFTLIAATAALAADEQQLALALKAQSDYDRVTLAAAPQLHDTIACVQSQAALLPVGSPEEVPLIHFRRGYCALAGATITHDAREYAAAAGDFDKAIQAWPARAAPTGKKAIPEPASSALPVLAWLARLQAKPGEDLLARAQPDMLSAVETANCPSSVMSRSFCRSVLDTGKQWLGWIALGHGDLDTAAKEFAAAPDSGWPQWIAGNRDFEASDYGNAIREYRRAIEIFESRRHVEQISVLQRVAPQPVLTDVYTDLGGAQLLAGDSAAAIRSLNQAIKESASNSRAYYLRARAKEAAGQVEAALADYNLASRTSFASSENLASGEAHLYRGIAMYRRKNYPQAEEEFSSALNFDVAPAVRADATAWRHMAAAASGSCGSSRQLLESSLPATSKYFPREEAKAVIASCTAERASHTVH